MNLLARLTLALLVSSALTSVASAQAPPENPAPPVIELPVPAGPGDAAPPRPSDPPAQREPEAAPPSRARSLLELGSGILGGLGGNGPGAVPTAEVIDVPKLNRQVEKVAGPILTEDPRIERFQIQLDESSDLARDRIRGKADLSLKESAWSEGPTNGTLNVTAAVDPQNVAHIVAEVDIHSDSVGLVSYLINRLAGREIAELPAIPTADELFRFRLQQRLKALPPLADFDELADLVASFSSLRIGAHNDAIEILKFELETGEHDEVTYRELIDQLYATRMNRDKLFFSQIRILRDAQGYANAVDLQMINAEILGMQAKSVVLHVTPAHVHIDLHVERAEGVALYRLFKPVAIRVVHRFQESDPAIVERAKGLLELGVGVMAQAILGPR